MLSIATSVGQLAEPSSAAKVYWSSFRSTKNPIIGSQIVQMSRFFSVLIEFFIEFFIVSCSALSWREEPSIDL